MSDLRPFFLACFLFSQTVLIPDLCHLRRCSAPTGAVWVIIIRVYKKKTCKSSPVPLANHQLCIDREEQPARPPRLPHLASPHLCEPMHEWWNGNEMRLCFEKLVFTSAASGFRSYLSDLSSCTQHCIFLKVTEWWLWQLGTLSGTRPSVSVKVDNV